MRTQSQCPLVYYRWRLRAVLGGGRGRRGSRGRSGFLLETNDEFQDHDEDEDGYAHVHVKRLSGDRNRFRVFRLFADPECRLVHVTLELVEQTLRKLNVRGTPHPPPHAPRERENRDNPERGNAPAASSFPPACSVRAHGSCPHLRRVAPTDRPEPSCAPKNTRLVWRTTSVSNPT